MPARKKSIPSYLHHKPSGRAYVKIRRADGSRQTIYLGPWDTPESRAEYARILTNHVPKPVAAPAENCVAPAGPLTVTALAVRFMQHAQVYYRRPDGTQTDEVANYRAALRPLNYLFGDLAVTEFGPKCLKKVRELMLEGYDHPTYGPQPALCRNVINSRIGRIVRAFKWGVVEELLPETVHRTLDLVPGLQANRTNARETQEVPPVAWEVVEKTLAFLPEVVRSMVLLMWHTGMRPGECCSITASEIDRSGPVWLYRPSYHKLAYRGKPRVIAVGQQGQSVLQPYLEREGFLFSPAEAVRQVREAQQQNRTTKAYAYEEARRQRRNKATPKRKPREKYTVAVLDRAIERAAIRAGVEHWHPNQLRHSFATRVRAQFGLEEAQVALGHSHAAITEIYAAKNQALAVRVAETMG